MSGILNCIFLRNYYFAWLQFWFLNFPLPPSACEIKNSSSNGHPFLLGSGIAPSINTHNSHNNDAVWVCGMWKKHLPSENSYFIRRTLFGYADDARETGQTRAMNFPSIPKFFRRRLQTDTLLECNPFLLSSFILHCHCPYSNCRCDVGKFQQILNVVSGRMEKTYPCISVANFCRQLNGFIIMS